MIICQLSGSSTSQGLIDGSSARNPGYDVQSNWESKHLCASSTYFRPVLMTALHDHRSASALSFGLLLSEPSLDPCNLVLEPRAQNEHSCCLQMGRNPVTVFSRDTRP
jgi:hypothetical protein